MIKNSIIVALITINVVFAWAFFQPRTAVNPESQQPDQKIIVSEETETLTLDSTTSEPETAIKSLTELDYFDAIEQLRVQGFDESTIRQLMLAKINREYLLLEAGQPESPYWLPEGANSDEQLSAELSWEADRREQLLSLFGLAIVDDPLFAHIFKPLNGSLAFLSSEKQIRLDELQRLDEARTQNLFRNGFTQESRGDLAAQRADLQREITELLGIDDDFEYQLRESRLAETMRRGLGTFDYSEDEFRELFAIRQSIEGNQQSTRFTDRGEFRRQRDQSEAEIRDYLGDTRYEEYARSQDPAYRSLQSIGERYGNSTAEINDVYSIAQDTQERITELRSSNTMTRDERIERINTLRSEAYDEIEQIAGKDTAESVRENSRRLGFGRDFRPQS